MNKRAASAAPTSQTAPPGIVIDASPAPAALSLRDEFAKSAPPPPAWWVNLYTQRGTAVDTAAFAAWAYEYADAMLVERAK